VHLTLDLSSTKPGEGALPIRDFEIGILPEVSEAAGPKWWTIRGRVRSAIQCDPPFVDFGRESELAQPLSPRRAAIKTFASLRNLTASCNPPRFDVKVERRSVEESDRFDLLVTPHGSLPQGEIRCTISLVPELNDGRRLAAKKVEVGGRVVGDIEASPPTILLGACSVGMTAEETIALRSLTGRAFAVTGMRCEGAGLSVERLRKARQFDPAFQVKQSIDAKEERLGKVILGVRPDGGEEREVVVPVSSRGIDGGTH
jgi:hypothetical protein